MTIVFDLAFLWAWLLAFAVLAYVLLDGFDLGIGIVFPFFGDEPTDHGTHGGDRTLMMDSVAPVWDGNETWLVFGGGALLAAFPLAYSALLPAFYAPLIAMLLALIFRGVSFEFRGRTRRLKWLWDLGFTGGSTLAAFCQGLMLGAFVQGIEVEGRHYAGGWFDWLTPFTMLTGFAVVAGYGMLGCGWLVLKTGGALQARCYELMRRFTVLVLLAIAAVSIWTPFIDPAYARRWFSFPNVLYTLSVPVLVAALAVALFASLARRRELAPFLYAQALFVVCFIGFGVSVFPYIVPRAITIWEAAAPRSSLLFMLVGAVILIPVILAYTAHAYWVFRGKTLPGSGYH